MPRRPSNVNQADVRRVIRACKLEKIPFRVILQPNGAAIFEPLLELEAEQAAQPMQTQPKEIVL